MKTYIKQAFIIALMVLTNSMAFAANFGFGGFQITTIVPQSFNIAKIPQLPTANTSTPAAAADLFQFEGAAELDQTIDCLNERVNEMQTSMEVLVSKLNKDNLSEDDLQDLQAEMEAIIDIGGSSDKCFQ